MNENICLKYNTEITLTRPDGSKKLLWSENALGRKLRQAGRECRIPFVTGTYGYTLRSHNLVTNVGHAAANAKMSGQGSYGNFTNIAIGIGTTPAAATDTALQSEITTGGGSRGAATVTQTTVNVTNDSTSLSRTFTFTSAFAVTEEGIFDNAVAGGSMLAHQVFAAVNVASGDSLSIVHVYTT